MPAASPAWMASRMSGGAARPSNARRSGTAGMRAMSALDGPGHDAADEVALQQQEHDQRYDHGHECTSRQDVPLVATVPDEDVQCGRQHALGFAGAQEDEGDEQVIPDPQELED